MALGRPVRIRSTALTENSLEEQMRFTAKDLGKLLDVDDIAARGVLNFMIKHSVVECVGEQARADGKGRAAQIWAPVADAQTKLAGAFKAMLEGV